MYFYSKWVNIVDPVGPQSTSNYQMVPKCGPPRRPSYQSRSHNPISFFGSLLRVTGSQEAHWHPYVNSPKFTGQPPHVRDCPLGRNANGSILGRNLLVSISEPFNELGLEIGFDSDSKLGLWFRILMWEKLKVSNSVSESVSISVSMMISESIL